MVSDFLYQNSCLILDRLCKTDLDFLDWFGRENLQPKRLYGHFSANNFEDATELSNFVS